MALPDVSRWTLMSRTSTAFYYQVEPRTLAGVGIPAACDTAETAQENVDALHAFFSQHGPGVSLMFIDHAGDQSARARRVYRERTDPTLVIGVVVVAGSLLARAIGSFFLGVSRPKMPFKIVGNLDEALRWSRQRLADHDETLQAARGRRNEPP